MKSQLFGGKTSIFLVLAILLSGVLSGCAGKGGSDDMMTDPIVGDGTELTTGVVGDYSDLALPSDMEYINKESMAIRTDSFKGGILRYSGRVEIESLKGFIIASMKKNQWKMVGEAHYKNVLMAFTKPNKTCMVVVSEGMGGALGKTYVTLYVTYDIAAANRLTPFGEPME